MKSILKDIIYKFLSLFNFNGAVVLMYHSVGNNTSFFTVKPADFKKQMEYLYYKKFNVVSLEKLFDYMESKKSPPTKTIVLTFDDGYKDNFTEVFLILKKFNFPATIFLTTDIIGKENINSEGIGLDMLNEDEIREMHRSGLIDFEPHTLTHPRLTQITKSEVEREVLQSKKIIENMLAKKCFFFAYPFGAYNKEIIDIIKSNFRMIFSVKNGMVNLFSGMFELERNSIDSEVNQTQFKGIVKFGRI